MPNLKINTFQLNQDGLINDVVIINDELVFRFSKAEAYNSILQSEIKVLDLVRPGVHIKIPEPVFTSDDCMVYPFLEGASLTRRLILEQDEYIQDRLMYQLALFLKELHQTDTSAIDWELSGSLAPTSNEELSVRYLEIRKKIFPLLLPHQVEWVEQLFSVPLEQDAFFNHKPALIHGDLSPYHILFDEGEKSISGVIDFGVAGIRDPALDIGGLLNFYGESLVRKMIASYPEIAGYIPRARFFAQEIELQWILRGLDSGESFWFTAHIAGARDIYS